MEFPWPPAIRRGQIQHTLGSEYALYFPDVLPWARYMFDHMVGDDDIEAVIRKGEFFSCPHERVAPFASALINNVYSDNRGFCGEH